MTRDKVTVYTLTIDHKHGTDTSVYRTYEAAHKALAEYAREWWTVDNGWSPGQSMTREEFDSLPDEAAIDEYFDRMRDLGEEFYSLDSATLKD